MTVMNMISIKLTEKCHVDVLIINAAKGKNKWLNNVESDVHLFIQNLITSNDFVCNRIEHQCSYISCIIINTLPNVILFTFLHLL